MKSGIAEFKPLSPLTLGSSSPLSGPCDPTPSSSPSQVVHIATRIVIYICLLSKRETSSFLGSGLDARDVSRCAAPRATNSETMPLIKQTTLCPATDNVFQSTTNL